MAAVLHGRCVGRRCLVALGAAVLLGASVTTAPAAGFGTIRGIGQDAEHEKTTRGAIACVPGQTMPDVPGRCFEPLTTDEVAGTSRPDLPERVTVGNLGLLLTELPGQIGTFGAVGAPDIESFFADVPHCLGGDWLPTPDDDYPQTRAQARRMLSECHDFLRGRFNAGIRISNGLVDAVGRIVPAAVEARACPFIDFNIARAGILGFAGDIKRHRKASFGPNPKLYAIEKALRVFEQGIFAGQGTQVLPAPQEGSDKCRVLGNIGHVFHGIQDFYAHGNWTDRSTPTRPQGLDNPPGMDRSGRPPLMNMLVADPSIHPGLITACFTFLLDQCKGRIDHDAALGKDKGVVTVTVTGALPNPMEATNAVSPRGRVQANWRRAILGAERESWLDWKDFGGRLLAVYGAPRGTQMICAITHDDPLKDCAVPGTTITTEVGPIVITGGGVVPSPSEPSGPTDAIG